MDQDGTGRRCPTGSANMEDVVHFLTKCALYAELKDQYLKPLATGMKNNPLYIQFCFCSLAQAPIGPLSSLNKPWKNGTHCPLFHKWILFGECLFYYFIIVILCFSDCTFVRHQIPFLRLI